jgi:hypothetical protein
MEVHHHPHVAKKNFKEYLLEFLMIFLAVFLGFIAENVREGLGNHKREKEYIQSMIQDLQRDTSNLTTTIAGYENKDKRFDTVFALYPALTSGYNGTLINNLQRVQNFPDFVYTDRTIQQLKNSGGMSLIKDKKAADAIIEYDSKMRELDKDMPILIEFFNTVVKSWQEIFSTEAISKDEMQTDAQVNNRSKNYLLKSDKATLGRFYNELKAFRSSCRSIRHEEEFLKQDAESLIILLKKEYHLKTNN